MTTVRDEIEETTDGEDTPTPPSPRMPFMKYTIFDAPVLNVVTRFLSLILLRLIGWRQGGERPTPPRYVLIAAPHTSNWDFLLLMAFAFRCRVRLYWMGKDAIFKGWYSPFVKFVGGIPIDRKKQTGMVAQTAELFAHSERLVVTVPAEGTRSRSEGWKSGFYHIAMTANVPVVLGFLDYAKKVGGFGPAVTLTGDMQADMVAITDFYRDIGARYPEKKTEPRILPTTPAESDRSAAKDPIEDTT